jgi:hypothetical protein
MKNHPTPEEWMSFLYGEDAPARHLELDGHLRSCHECRRQVQAWQGSMSALEGWAVPQKRARWPLQPAVRWAAAALLVLGLGFGIGRASSPSSANLKELQVAMQDEMKASLGGVRQEFVSSLQQQRAELADTIHAAASHAASEETEDLFTRFARLFEERRESDQQSYLAALNEIKALHLNSYAALRQDLDTLAVNADDGLSRAQEQLLELATIARPGEN